METLFRKHNFKIEINELSGTPEELAQRVPPKVNFKRSIETVKITLPMLILGSSQSEKYFKFKYAKDHFDNGISLCRRSSGGGAVLVIPGSFFWFNLLIPIEDEFHESNLTKSFNFLGDRLALALNRFYGINRRWPLTIEGNIDMFKARQARLESSFDGKLWCYLDGNFGEVYRGEKKVVGISQRRNMFGSCFYIGINLQNRFKEMDDITDYELVEQDFSDKFSGRFNFTEKIEALPDLNPERFIELFIDELDA